MLTLKITDAQEINIDNTNKTVEIRCSLGLFEDRPVITSSGNKDVCELGFDQIERTEYTPNRAEMDVHLKNGQKFKIYLLPNLQVGIVHTGADEAEIVHIIYDLQEKEARSVKIIDRGLKAKDVVLTPEIPVSK